MDRRISSKVMEHARASFTMTPSEKKSMKTMERELEDMREQHGELKKKLDEAKAQRIDNLVKKGVSAFLGLRRRSSTQKEDGDSQKKKLEQQNIAPSATSTDAMSATSISLELRRLKKVLLESTTIAESGASASKCAQLLEEAWRALDGNA